MALIKHNPCNVKIISIQSDLDGVVDSWRQQQSYEEADVTIINNIPGSDSCLRIINRKGFETGGTHRTEVYTRRNLGADRWVGVRYFFPTNYINDSSEEVIFQVHALGGSPAVALETINGLLRVQRRSGVTPGSPTRVQHNLGTLPKGRWINFVFHYVMNPSGKLEVWQDGAKVIDYSGALGFSSLDPIEYYPKVGIYKWMYTNDPSSVASDERIFYLDDFKFGDENSSFAEVSPEVPYYGPWHYAPETGNDFGNGSETQPFETWSKVLSSLTNTTEGRQIKIKCGEVGPAISISSKPGTETDKYYVTNYGSGANPVISGFAIPSWVGQGGNIWAYSDSGFTTVNLLKIGNGLRHKGRLPKTGYNTITDRNSNTQITDTVDLPAFPDVVGGELVAKKNKWVMDTQTITEQTSTTLTTNVASGYPYTVGYGYFVQNHANCLTENGDWYYDSATKTVYLYHDADPNQINIQIGKSENCLYQQSSSYWEFFGIDFEGSTKEAVILRSSHNVKFTRCSFNFHGFNGVQTWLSRYATVEYCHFNDIQNIAVNNRDTGESLGSSDMLIRNCFINGIAMIPGASGNGDGQACGIIIGVTEHNVTIQNNRFHNLGYIGVYAAGNNCLVESNYAENGCLVKSDGALFYTFGPFENIRFIRNIAINCIGNVDGTNHSDWFGVGDCAGFYADDNSNGVLFEDNYATSTQYGFYGHNCRNIIVRNNVFINNHIQVRLTDDGYDNPALGDPIQNLNIYNNTLIAGSGQFIYELRATGGSLQYGTINNNQIKSTDENSYRIRREGSMSNPGTTLENLSQWRTNRVYDIDSILYDYDQDKELILVNETEGTELFELDAVYDDIAGVEHSGSIQLDENESIYLYKTSDTPPVDEYTIDVTVIGSGNVSGSGTYEDGQEVDLLATPETGWSFLHWSDIDGIYLDNPISFIAEGNRSLEAIFVEDTPPVDEYNVTLIAGTGGTVSGGGVYEDGEQATATATPNTGWHFVRWSNDVTDNPYTFTVTGAITLQAIFAQDEPVPGVIIVKGKFRIV